MSKPDRFERMVAKQVAVDECGPNAIWAQSAVVLLRKEHRAVRKIVRREPDNLNPTIVKTDWGKGYQAACRAILAALDKRSK